MRLSEKHNSPKQLLLEKLSLFIFEKSPLAHVFRSDTQANSKVSFDNAFSQTYYFRGNKLW